MNNYAIFRSIFFSIIIKAFMAVDRDLLLQHFFRTPQVFKEGVMHYGGICTSKDSKSHIQYLILRFAMLRGSSYSVCLARQARQRSNLSLLVWDPTLGKENLRPVCTCIGLRIRSPATEFWASLLIVFINVNFLWLP